MRLTPSTLMLIAISAFASSSCGDRSFSKAIDPPPTPLLSRPLGWAVVEASYSQVFDQPKSDGVVLGYYRRATVVPVTERRNEIDGSDSVVWLRNEGDEPGWIRQADVRVFDSPEKARTAVKTVIR